MGVVGTVAASTFGAAPLVEAVKLGAITASVEMLSHRQVPGLVKGRRLQALKKIAVGAAKGLATGAASLIHPALGIAVGLSLYAGDRYLTAQRTHQANIDSLDLGQSRQDGMDGSGTTIAVLDTGFGDHPVFAERTITESNFTSEEMREKDRHGHATAMAGAAANVAPGADFAFLKVADSKGKDTLRAKTGAGNDVAVQKGGKGKDKLVAKGGQGNDVIRQNGGAGNDVIRVKGGAGNDTIRVRGGAGNDRVVYTQQKGNDDVELRGGKGNDTLVIDRGTNFQLVGANGKVLHKQGNGGQVINVSGFENYKLKGKDGKVRNLKLNG